MKIQTTKFVPNTKYFHEIRGEHKLESEEWGALGRLRINVELWNYINIDSFWKTKIMV